MGHIRLGRLPKTHRWREVVSLLELPASTAELAGTTARAAELRLGELSRDAAFGYPLWLLIRVTWAARGDAFLEDLRGVGIDLPEYATTLGAISALTLHVRDETSEWAERDHLSEFALQAFQQALTETVAREGLSLFEGSIEDVQRAFRTYSTRARFGELSRRFFAAFMSRTLRAFVDRELANHVGRDRKVGNVSDSADFLDALHTHVWQTSAIVEQFAGDWYSKHNWESKGQVSPQETQQFAGYALAKLRAELQSEMQR